MTSTHTGKFYVQLSEEMQDCFLWRLHNFLSLLGTCKRSKVPKPPSTLVIIHISILAIPRGITAHCDFAIHFVKDLGFKHLSISQKHLFLKIKKENSKIFSPFGLNSALQRWSITKHFQGVDLKASSER